MRGSLRRWRFAVDVGIGGCSFLVGSLVGGAGAWRLMLVCTSRSGGPVDIYSKLFRSLLCMSITGALV